MVHILRGFCRSRKDIKFKLLHVRPEIGGKWVIGLEWSVMGKWVMVNWGKMGITLLMGNKKYLKEDRDKKT